MTRKIFLENAYERNATARVTAVEGAKIRLDETIFYAASGGQPGDRGYLSVANQNIPVLDTIKGANPDEIWHVLPDDIDMPAIGQSVYGTIDWDLRHKHMRMHTCLHLICALVKGDVTGGAVGADKGRLDFNIGADAVDKDSLEIELNRLIAEDHAVTYEWITDADLAANPGLVRTMSVKPPTGGGRVRLVRIGGSDHIVDLQPCGGTHVRSTSEIGSVLIPKIENKGKQNRRISVVFVT